MGNVHFENGRQKALAQIKNIPSWAKVYLKKGTQVVRPDGKPDTVRVDGYYLKWATGEVELGNL